MTGKSSTIAIGAILLALFHVRPGVAQTSEESKALRTEIEALKQGQAAIQKELQELKSLLQGRAATPPPEPQNVVLSLKDDPFKGAKNAKVTLVEFSDYQCPFCARHARETLPRLEREYIATGKVKYVLRNFPITAIHPLAFKAHEAASCSGEQGKYWEMHDRLYANSKALALEDLSQHARALDLDLAIFQGCLDSGKHAGKIRTDLADGEAAGVKGTPTFFLGLTKPDDTQIAAVRVIRGAQPYATIKTAIDSLLATKD